MMLCEVQGCTHEADWIVTSMDKPDERTMLCAKHYNSRSFDAHERSEAVKPGVLVFTAQQEQRIKDLFIELFRNTLNPTGRDKHPDESEPTP